MQNSEKNPYVVSLLFDKKLMELGKWSDEIYSKLEEWNETTDYEMQRARAASLISDIIVKILDKDCSSRGRIRARHLGKSLANFEQIIISARGLERKFYRDHLNHVIRVALLSRAIGRQPPFNLRPKDLDKLVLCSLFHDVAYPLAEIAQSIQFSVKAIRDCYNIASRGPLAPGIRLNLERLPSSDSIYLHISKNKPEELDHGILSALEFMSYLEPDKNLVRKYAEVIEAIALHSPSNIKKISSPQEKILAILVLADELQDWGRPVAHSNHFSFMPKVEKFKIGSHKLQGEYNGTNILEFSLLRQLHGKTQSLVRVNLPRDFNFNLRFLFDNFDGIGLKEIENSLQLLFEKCNKLENSLFHPSYFKKLYESNSTFESAYYGKPIPKKVKLGLFRLLSAGKLSSRSPFNNYQLLFNHTIKELLIANVEISPIRHFQFTSSSSGPIMLQSVTKSNDVFCGAIKQTNDSEVANLSMFLLSEIRFMNICLQKVAKFRTKNYPVDIGYEGFPQNKDVSKAIKITNQLKLPDHVRLMFELKDCIFHDGVFLFKSSD